ncbi:coiled-coil domain-containing protein 187 isoform X2 [Triplophysa dalaica]|uniref:coiled-coil domain-containing protein 187 isoform X2 n=1 Tax=Triplophysa dalaica TaxID=1582913 RepID=UPI0024DF3900|nr:coiled-coil domain-containing protein 187 isoform X2 [Triplophysa dalaica]
MQQVAFRHYKRAFGIKVNSAAQVPLSSDLNGLRRNDGRAGGGSIQPAQSPGGVPVFCCSGGWSFSTQLAGAREEEHDSEYAQMIQKEIQRCAEEARRREVEDEEIAKRIQEEEELGVRSRGSYQNRDARETSSVPPYSPRSVYSPEDRYYECSSTRRRERSQLPPYSDSEDNRRMPTVTNLSRGSQDCSSSTVGQRTAVSCGRPPRSHSDQDNKSTTSGSSFSQKSRTSHLSGGWGDVIKLIRNDMSEQGYLSPSSEEELFEPVYKLERMLKQKQQASDRRGHQGERRHGRTTQGDGWCREESFRERDKERRVHFLDERSRINGYHGNGYSLHENGRERDKHLNTGERLGDHQQTQDPGFRRNVSMRRSYHGDVRLSRRTSMRGGSRTCTQDDSNLVNMVRPLNHTPLIETEVRRPGPLREAERWEAARNQRQRACSLTEERTIDRDHTRYPRQHRIRRSQSERQSLEEEGSSTEEEMESRREVGGMERLSSLSTCQSRSGHSSRTGPTGRNRTTALDLGELEQVLLDEELARRLQEEERLAAETQQGSSPLSPEDFRMAQVAQDEEIARFIQKQEIKAKRRSAELDFVGPRREYRDTVTDYERRAECDGQRERMDSDGLLSPIDDSTADHQLSSPVSMAAQPTRNVAEDLDPTFHRKEINGANQGSQQGGLCNPMDEQPTFVPPTKRHNDKPVRVKSKDKKENIKQKENCKQQ